MSDEHVHGPECGQVEVISTEQPLLYYAAGDDPPGSGGLNTLGNALAAAQVHATLALAAATAEPYVADYTGSSAGREWAAVLK